MEFPPYSTYKKFIQVKEQLSFTPFHVAMCNDEVSSEHLAFTLSCHAYVCR